MQIADVQPADPAAEQELHDVPGTGRQRNGGAEVEVHAGPAGVDGLEPEVDLGVIVRPPGPRFCRRYSTRSGSRRLSHCRPCSTPFRSRNTIAEPTERPSPSTAQV